MIMVGPIFYDNCIIEKKEDFRTGVDNGAYVYDGYDIDRGTTRSKTVEDNDVYGNDGTDANRRLTRPKILVTKGIEVFNIPD